MKDTDHSRHVNSWMEQAAQGVPATSLLDLFEAAWGALWRRSEDAVGEIVLVSIAELIRSNAVEKYPFLAPLKLGAADVSCKAIFESASSLERRELKEGLRFVLTKFITIIGDLTDQILSQGLYDELARITPGPRIRPFDAPDKRDARESASGTTPAKEEIGMMKKGDFVTTGIHNLDTMLAGGLIKGSSTAIMGIPGSGKTILAQQIAFHNAAPNAKVLYFSTLSEPGAKTLAYLKKFNYFDQKKSDDCIE